MSSPTSENEPHTRDREIRPHILMCAPVFYGIEYEINPWMNTERRVNHKLAGEQWRALYDLLVEAGANVSEVTPVQGLPDLVFTANAALVYGRRAVVSHFRHTQRQGEEAYFREWLVDHGWAATETPAGCSFEGAGDALFCGDTLYAGYRLRSDARGHQKIAEQLGVRVLPLELVDPYYYHLDTCFCPLSAEAAIYFPPAFDDYGRRVLQANIPTLIEVAADEAQSFACNAVVVGRTVITNDGCPRLQGQLERAGFCPLATPLGEFVKAGGSAKCLTLRLDGEDAAAWRTEKQSRA
jgi:N-dimethylarginine dimethylaminohydrolase